MSGVFVSGSPCTSVHVRKQMRWSIAAVTLTDAYSIMRIRNLVSLLPPPHPSYCHSNIAESSPRQSKPQALKPHRYARKHETAASGVFWRAPVKASIGGSVRLTAL